MATTKIWPVRGRLGNVVIYAENPDKTWNPEYEYSDDDLQNLRDVMDAAIDGYKSSPNDDEAIRAVMEYAKDEHKTDKQYFVSGVNCDAATAREKMMLTKQLYRKKGGIVAHHGYQSFVPGEVTPAMAHEIGVKLAQEMWGDRFEVLVCTHLNTHSVHNHFVVNSVSYVDGRKYYGNTENYHKFRGLSDRLCHEYSLSVIKEPKGRSKSYVEWKAERDGIPTVRSTVRQDVDRAISESMTWRAFLLNLQKQGYTLKTNVKHIAIRPPGKERFIRLRSLGAEYEEDAIKARILRQQQPTRRKPPTYYVRQAQYRGVFDFTLHKVTFKSIRALYYHYLQILKQAQARSPDQEPAPFAVREDLRIYNELRDQVRFLHQHGIDTAEQLSALRDNTQSELDALTAKRKALHDEKRHIATTPEQKAALTAQTDAITKRTNIMRRNIQLCADILTRSPYLYERCAELKKQRQLEGRTQDEPNRRRSRSGSPDGHDHNDRSGQDRSGHFH